MIWQRDSARLTRIGPTLGSARRRSHPSGGEFALQLGALATHLVLPSRAPVDAARWSAVGRWLSGDRVAREPSLRAETAAPNPGILCLMRAPGDSLAAADALVRARATNTRRTISVSADASPGDEGVERSQLPNQARRLSRPYSPEAARPRGEGVITSGAPNDPNAVFSYVCFWRERCLVNVVPAVTMAAVPLPMARSGLLPRGGLGRSSRRSTAKTGSVDVRAPPEFGGQSSPGVRAMRQIM
jgi:hypothetical protein